MINFGREFKNIIIVEMYIYLNISNEFYESVFVYWNFSN